VEENGALQLVQSTEVYEVAKEAHSGSEDDIDEDLADRMDMCEV
jgi:NTP pyrophosphatase (non-canonical NTP hydrolase)